MLLKLNMDVNMKKFIIWRGSPYFSTWIKTSEFVMARTQKEANAKTKRKFANAGFSSMSLFPVEDGIDPNVKKKQHAD